MTNERREENLWSLANGITSFAALQALAFLYALKDKPFRREIGGCVAQPLIVVLTLVFTVGYCVAVWRCKRLSGVDNDKVWHEATIGRIATIVILNTIVLGIDTLIALKGAKG